MIKLEITALVLSLIIVTPLAEDVGTAGGGTATTPPPFFELMGKGGCRGTPNPFVDANTPSYVRTLVLDLDACTALCASESQCTGVEYFFAPRPSGWEKFNCQLQTRCIANSALNSQSAHCYRKEAGSTAAIYLSWCSATTTSPATTKFQLAVEPQSVSDEFTPLQNDGDEEPVPEASLIPTTIAVGATFRFAAPRVNVAESEFSVESTALSFEIAISTVTAGARLNPKLVAQKLSGEVLGKFEPADIGVHMVTVTALDGGSQSAVARRMLLDVRYADDDLANPTSTGPGNSTCENNGTRVDDGVPFDLRYKCECTDSYTGDNIGENCEIWCKHGTTVQGTCSSEPDALGTRSIVFYAVVGVAVSILLCLICMFFCGQQQWEEDEASAAYVGGVQGETPATPLQVVSVSHC